jgi:hypothetical protein
VVKQWTHTQMVKGLNTGQAIFFVSFSRHVVLHHTRITIPSVRVL